MDDHPWGSWRLARGLIAAQQWDRLNRLLNACNSPHLRASIHEQLITALIEAGDWQRLQATVAVTSAHLRDRTLAALVERLADAGRWDEAHHAADSITDPQWRLRALSQLAFHLSDVDPQRATDLMDPLARAADVGDAPHHVADFCQALAATGNGKLAEQIAHNLPDRDYQPTVIACIMRGYVKVGRVSDAVHLATSLTDSRERTHALTELIAITAPIDPSRAAALVHNATVAADSIQDADDQVEAMADLCRTLIETRLIPEAETVARAIPTLPQRASALVDVTTAHGHHRVTSQLVDEISKLIDAIHDPELKSRTTARLSAMLAQIGLWNRAEQTATSIDYPDLRTDALVNLAAKRAQTQQIHEAERIVSTIRTSDGRARALRHIIESLAGEALSDGNSVPTATRFAIIRMLAVSLQEDDPFSAIAAAARAAPREVKSLCNSMISAMVEPTPPTCGPAE